MKYIVRVEPLDEPRHWKLLDDFNYREITVPSGFTFDGASIPLGLRWLFPHGGAKFAAACLHDYCYQTGIVDRITSDKYFLEVMLENGVNKWKAKAMYLGVRSGGWVTWNKYRRGE